MKKNRIKYSLVFAFSLVVIENCYAQGFIHTRVAQAKTSLPITHPLIKSAIVPEARTFFACYSILDGTPLNCTFISIVNGLKTPEADADNNGGHFHGYKTRNFTYKKTGIQYPADTNPDRLVVEGSTLSTPPFTFAKLIHKMPQVSGSIEVESLMMATRGWVCVTHCYTRNSWRYLTTYDIGIKDLSPLPVESPSDPYVRVRTKPDNDHPFAEAYYGASGTIQLLPLIAENYYLLRGRKLSINDMGLRKGGLFDVFGNWKRPHNSHREGKDVDLNRDDADCLTDTSLFLAVDMILPPLRVPNGTPTAVLCESGGRKHIDFELGL